jgi:hypothetical protein
MKSPKLWECLRKSSRTAPPILTTHSQAQGGGIQYQQEEHQPSHPCVLTKKMGPSGKAFETSALLLACSLASVTYLQISGTGHCRLVHLLPIGKLRSCIPSIKLPSILITLFVWNQYLEQR